ncbi:MAG TPA: hypothetical protein VFB12_20760 [Ktedonobacteraceae bacterium]|nr:hypothetical protein [Ktedonobacteraceae bacterium]
MSEDLWHTIRQADGTWALPFIRVQEQTARVGSQIGPVRQAVCATNQDRALHICVIDRIGNLWHTIRQPNGIWPFPFRKIQDQTILVGSRVGPIQQVACATDRAGDLHICAVDYERDLWHTIRRADGTWPFPFVRVQDQVSRVGSHIGPIQQVACATNPNRDLHICAIDRAGNLWHTIRRADGTWSFPFLNVQDQALGSRVGATPGVACAANPNGDLHICTLDFPGTLWHTMRRADGTWPFPFSRVQDQTARAGSQIGPIQQMACATNTNGDLHICALVYADHIGNLWHTIRQADGTWPFPFRNVQEQTRQLGPYVGLIHHVACAADPSGDLHICAIDRALP